MQLILLCLRPDHSGHCLYCCTRVFPHSQELHDFHAGSCKHAQTLAKREFRQVFKSKSCIRSCGLLQSLRSLKWWRRQTPTSPHTVTVIVSHLERWLGATIQIAQLNGSTLSVLGSPWMGGPRANGTARIALHSKRLAKSADTSAQCYEPQVKRPCLTCWPEGLPGANLGGMDVRR